MPFQVDFCEFNLWPSASRTGKERRPLATPNGFRCPETTKAKARGIISLDIMVVFVGCIPLNCCILLFGCIPFLLPNH